jgi:Mu-like prophage protein gp36
MARFISDDDYKASIKQEQLDALTREDAAIVPLAEDQAIEEMKGYLCQRYDTDAIFGAAGTARNKLIVMFCIDIALYHMHTASNPLRFPEARKDRYKRAVDWLEMVQKGEIIPSDLPLKQDATAGTQGGANSIAFFSQTKRNNAF